MTTLKNIAAASVFAGLMAGGLPLMAQSSKVTSAWNYMRYKEYDKARDAINDAVKNEKTMNEAKTWFYRAQIYRGLAEDEKLKATEPNAAAEAFSSLKKTQELDKSQSYADQVKTEYFALAFDLYNTASVAYNEGGKDPKNYAVALDNFLAYQEAEGLMGDENRKSLEKTLKESNIDPMKVQQLIGSSAQLSGNSEKAIEYYSQLVNAKFNDAGVYVALSNLYKAKGDTATALATLDKGMAAVADSKDIINSKLDIYLRQGKKQEVIDLGRKAMELDPNNENIYIAVGNAYYQMGMAKDAEALYAKALAINPEAFNTNYSVGLALFNQGAAKYNASIEEKSVAKQKKLEDESIDFFKRAIPYLEKAHAKEPADREVMQLLAEMYGKTGDYTKAKQFTDLLKQGSGDK